MNAYFFSRYSANSQRDRKHQKGERLLVQAECAQRQWTYNKDPNFFGSGENVVTSLHDTLLNRFLQAAKQERLLPNPVLVLMNLAFLTRGALVDKDSKLWNLLRYGVAILFFPSNLLLEKGDEHQPQKYLLLLYEFERARLQSQRTADLIKAANKFKADQAANGIPVNGEVGCLRGSSSCQNLDCLATTP